MDKEIFTLISKVEEKEKIFQDLANAHGEIICKGQDENLIKLRVQTYQNKILECRNESSTTFKNGEDFLGYLFLGGEKYYFEGKFQAQQDFCSLSLPAELYHLQRRQNYRVRVPDGYAASFNIVSANGKAANIAGRLADLSSQGCRVLYSHDNFSLKVEDHVLGYLIIEKKVPLELQGLIRHIKLTDGGQICGIEFSPLSSILENKLFAITMELHKEIFKRP